MAHTHEPFAQVCQGPSNPSADAFLVRAQVPLESLVASIRETVRRSTRRNRSAGRSCSRTSSISRSRRGSSTRSVGLLAIGALALAAIGVRRDGACGQPAHAEIGTRLAPGAAPASVLWLILRHGGRLALVGLTIGVVASFGLTRLLTSLLYDVGASDPITFASGAAIRGGGARGVPDSGAPRCDVSPLTAPPQIESGSRPQALGPRNSHS